MRAEAQRLSAEKAMRPGQHGFTLIELAISTLVLLVGVVAVMQLVPAAMQSNLNNRYDTTAAVIVQRLRDLMVNQLLSSTTLTDSTGMYPCGTTVVCNLGDPAQSDAVVGAPLTGTGEINFNASPVAGYSFSYADPNNPSGSQYDVRWAVVTSVRNIGVLGAGGLANVVVAKRFVVGARRRGGNPPASVTYSSWVSR